MGSLIFAHAARQWSRMRDDYHQSVEYAYNAAVEGTGGVLVNKLGRLHHIDGYSLFTDSTTRAYRYASEELVEWWKAHPRMSLAEYERNWMMGEQAYENP